MRGEKGLEEGRQEEAAALLLRQGRRHFGPLPPELEVRLDALPLARLEALADAISVRDCRPCPPRCVPVRCPEGLPVRVLDARPNGA